MAELFTMLRYMSVDAVTKEDEDNSSNDNTNTNEDETIDAELAEKTMKELKAIAEELGYDNAEYKNIMVKSKMIDYLKSK